MMFTKILKYISDTKVSNYTISRDLLNLLFLNISKQTWLRLEGTMDWVVLGGI